MQKSSDEQSPQQSAQRDLQACPKLIMHQSSIQIGQSLSLTYSYPSPLPTSADSIQLSVKMVPHRQMPNLPLQVQIKGYSKLETIHKNHIVDGLEITESVLLQDDENVQQGKGMIVKQSYCVEKGKKEEQEAIQTIKTGQCFLQGCQVLYQLDQHSKARLQNLTAQNQYKYPIEFMLPARLPVSLDHSLYPSLHLSIQYSFNLTVSYPAVDSPQTIQRQTINLPFELQLLPKIYPREQLVVEQKVRVYHQNGRRKKPKKKGLMRCCPECFSRFWTGDSQEYHSRFQGYDLYHVQVIVKISSKDTLIVTVRGYRQPQEQELSVNREKRSKSKDYASQKQHGQMPPQVSMASISIKQSQRGSPDPSTLSISAVQLKFFSELSMHAPHLHFTRSIPLYRSSYDISQGELIIDLSKYLSYFYSVQNQLFSLRHFFRLHRVMFGQGQWETMVAQERTMDLGL